uniref:uncharacterized protein LOC118532794 isoform X2 n=1 Tax=Halichoerus grypus TaxID=9711 RepID=UPI001658EF39|nr:uncharacterized protein LOC118532794 isoform X2 [Halichoerus grypus]
MTTRAAESAERGRLQQPCLLAGQWCAAGTTQPFFLQSPDTGRIKTCPAFPNESKDTQYFFHFPLDTLHLPRWKQTSCDLSVAGSGIPVTLHRAVILELLGRTVYLFTGTRVSREPVQMATDMTATPGHQAQRCTSCRILQNLRYFISTLIPSVVRDRKWSVLQCFRNTPDEHSDEQ